MTIRQFQARQAQRNQMTAHDRVVLAQLQAQTTTDKRPHRPWVRVVAKMMIVWYALQSMLLLNPAYAQTSARANVVAAPVVPSSTAADGKHPLVDSAANGVPVVMIAPPDKNGISHNQYEKFNVEQRGLILNNSKDNVATQLGGMIVGNLQLGRTPARLVLNEVTSTNPSQLNGFIEVAGQKVDVIIANPNGISCDGCGFLNTAGRGTLTTGNVQVDPQNGIGNIDVARGMIVVGAGGLNAGNLAQLDLLARGIVIEGEIATDKLNAILGSNKVVYGTLSVSEQSPGSAAPRFAVDIAELGGMFANQIHLIATEKGLGVNSQGRIASLGENLSLSTQGDLTLKDTYSKKDIVAAAAGAVTLTGQTSAGKDVVIQTPEKLTNAGGAVLRADQQVLLSVPHIDNRGAMLQNSTEHSFALAPAAQLSNRGIIYSATDLDLQAAAIDGQGGTLQAEQGMHLQAQTIDIGQQQLFARNALVLNADSISVAQSVLNGRDMTLRARQSLLLQGSEVSAAGNVAISAATLNMNTGAIAAGTDVTLEANRLAMRATQIQAGHDLALQAGAINANQTRLVAQNIQGVAASGMLDVGASQLGATGSVNLAGQGVSTAGAAIGASQIKIDAGTGTLDNSGGVVFASGRLDLAAHGIQNSAGQIGGGKTVAIDAKGGVLDNAMGVVSAPDSMLTGVSDLRNQGGSVFTNGDLDLRGRFDNHGGKVVAGGTLRVGGGAVDNRGGVLQAGGAVQIANGGQGIRNTDGTIQSLGSDIRLETDVLDNNGAVLAAGGNVEVNAGVLDNVGGKVSTNGSIVLAAGRLDGTNSTLAAGGPLTIAAENVVLTGSTLGSNESLTLTGSALTLDRANLLAGKPMRLTSSTLQATGASMRSAQDIVVAVDGDAALHGATLQAGGAIDINSGSLAATGMRTDSGAMLGIQSGATDLQMAQLQGQGGVTLATGALDLRDATVASGGNLRIDAASQTGGMLSAVNNVTLAVRGGLDLTGGGLAAGKAVAVAAQGIITDHARVSGDSVQLDAGQGRFHNQQGEVVATGEHAGGDTLVVRADGIDNHGGVLYSGKDASLDGNGQVLDNSGGQIAVAGKLQLNVSKLKNGAGSLATGSSIQLTGQEVDNTDGQLRSGQAIIIDTQGQLLDNTRGVIQAQDQLTIAAGQLNNVAGTLAANKQVDIKAQALDNGGAQIAAGQALNLTVAGAIASDKSRLTAGGAMTVSAQQFSANESTIVTNDKLALAVSGDAALDKSTVQAAAGIAINSNALSANGASLASNDAVRLIAQQGIDLVAARINALGAVEAKAQAGLNIKQAQLASNAGLTLSGMAIDASGANLNSGAAMQLTAGGGKLDLSGANLASGATLDLQGKGIDAAGAALAATNALTIDAHGADYRADGALHRSQAGTLAVNANNISVAGSGQPGATAGGFLAQGSIALNANGAIDVSRSVVASGRNIDLIAGGSLNNGGGQLIAAGAANVAASTVNNGLGVIDANEAVRIVARQGAVDNQGGQISTRSQLSLSTLSGLNRAAVLLDSSAGAVELNNAGGTIVGLGQVDIATAGIDNLDGQIASGADLTIGSGSSAFNGARGALRSKGSTTLTAGDVDISLGQVAAGQDAWVSGQRINLNGAALLAAAGNLKIDAASQQLDAGGATLQAGTALDLTAGDTILTQARLASGTDTHLRTGTLAAQNLVLAAGGDVTFNSNGMIDTTGANVSSNGKLGLAAVSLTGGSFSAGGNVDMRASAGIDLNHGRLLSNAVVDVKAQGLLLDDARVIGNRVKLDAGAGALSNARGTILATDTSGVAGALQLDSVGVDNRDGRISSNGDARLFAGAARLANEGGSINADADLTLQAGDIGNTGSSIAANGTVAIVGQAVENRGGSIQAGAGLHVSGANIDNRRGTLIGVAGVTVASAALDNSDVAVIASNGDLSVRSSGLNNDNSRITAGGALSLEAGAGGALSNRSGKIEADGAVALSSAADLDNTAGLIASGQQITLQSGGAMQNHGARITAGSGLLLGAANQIDNSSGSIEARGDASVRSGGQLGNANGQIVSTAALTIEAQGLDNQAALISSGAALAIDTRQAGGAIGNGGGRIQSNGAATVAAQGIDNQAGVIIARQGLGVDAGAQALDNRAGALQSLADSVTIASGSLNNSGASSIISAARDASIASSAAVDNSQAVISAGNHLSLTAQGALDNAQGQITAGGNLALQGAGIRNSGALASAGGALTLQAHAGALDNTNGKLLAGNTLSVASTGVLNHQGTIASNASLTVQSDNGGAGGSFGALDNTAGVIESTAGQVSLVTGDLHNQRSDPQVAASAGLIRAAQGIDITARGAVDNSGADIAAGANLRVGAAGSIANKGGSLVGATGLDVTGAGIDSADGVIGTNGALTLDGGSMVLDNTRGLISSGTDSLIRNGGNFVNAGGNVKSGANLHMQTGAFDNQNGLVSAQGNAVLNTKAFDNRLGTLVGAESLGLDTATQAFDNTGGQFGSNGELVFKTGNARLSNSVISTAKSFTFEGIGIVADNVSISAQDNITIRGGNGISDLSLNASDLQAGKAITVDGKAISLAGTRLAANDVIGIAGSSIAADNSVLRTQADISLVASGTLNLRAAELTAGRDLLATGGGTFDNAGASLRAGRNLNLATGQQFSFNAPGFSYQFGADLGVSANGISTAGLNVTGSNITLDAGSGLLDNGSGTIAASGSLYLAGAGINNRAGSIAANQSLALDSRGGLLDNAEASIGSAAGSTSINAGSLDNSSGRITAAGAIAIGSADLNNGGGQIVANSDVNIGGSSLNNVGGKVVSNNGSVGINSGSINSASGLISAGSQLSIDSGGTLDNSGGQLLAGSGATVRAASIANAAGTVSAQNAVIVRSNSGAIDNTHGVISSALSSATVDSTGSLDNRNGKIYGAGGATALAGSTLRNGAGIIGSGAAVRVDGGSIDNSAGIISGAGAASINGQSLNNAAGVISGGQSANLAIGSGAINNDAGVIEAGSGGMRISAGTISNSNSGAARGIVSAGNLDITATSLTQSAGYIGANGALSVAAAGGIDNSNSTLQGLTGVTLNAGSGVLGNASGGIKSGQDVGITAGTLNNAGGTVFATQDLTLSAGSIDNSGTRNGAYDKGLLAGRNASVSATTINNNGGAIVALNTANVTGTGSINNSNGQLSGNSLTIDTADFTNTQGRADATTMLTSRVRRFSADGVLASSGTLKFAMDGDYTNLGTVAANGNLDIELNGGKYTNNGNLSATSTLTLAAMGLDNNGSIIAQDASFNVGTLNNAGLINSVGTTTVNAGSTDNSGRIYGGAVAINGSVNNRANATIGSRGDLSISGSVMNNPGANIVSLGNMSLGAVVNAGATIEAGGNLSLGSLSNLNCVNGSGGNGVGASDCAAYGLQGGVALAQTTTNEWLNIVTIRPKDSTREYKPEQLETHYDGDGVNYYTLPGSTDKIEDYTQKTITSRTTVVNVLSQSNAGVVRAAGSISAGSAQNYDSQITAGGNISIGGGAEVGNGIAKSAFDTVNISTQGSQNVTESVQEFYTHVDNSCNALGGNCSHVRNNDRTNYYQVVKPPVTADVDGVVYDAYAGGMAPGVAAADTPANAPAAQTVTAIGPRVTADNDTRFGSNTSGNAGGNVSVDAGQGAVANPGSTVNVAALNPASNTTEAAAIDGVSTAAGATVLTTVSGGGSGVVNAGLQQNGAVAAVATTTQQAGSGGADRVTINTAGAPVVQGTAAGNVLPGSVIAGGVRAYQGAVIGDLVTEFGKIAAARPIALSVGEVSAGGHGATIQGVAAPANVHQPGASDVTLTRNTAWKAPSGNLFNLHPKDGAAYLVETDPAFTDNAKWLGGDYFLNQLKLDPERMLKRYGDGFAEQRAVADQLVSLTGHNTLDGYADMTSAFQGLMDAGVAFAKEFKLAPGVALSAQQMAMLTTDIVWMQEATVTLPDGSTTVALVPQVYLRRPQQGDLNTNGALIAGSNVTIRNPDGDIHNSGTILASQQGTVVLAGNNINNRGTVAGNAVALKAANDINNLGGRITGLSSTNAANDSIIQLSAGRDINLASTTVTRSINTPGTGGTNTSTATYVDRIATINGGNVRIDAAGNFTARGAQVTAATDLVVAAGKHIDIGTVQTSSTLDLAMGGNTKGRTGYVKDSNVSNIGSNLVAGNNVLLVAQGDASLTGSKVAGATVGISGINVDIAAATNRNVVEVQIASRNQYSRAMNDDQSLSGGVVTAGNKLTVIATGAPSGQFDADGKPVIQAGSGNLNLAAATLKGGTGSTVLLANNDINVLNLNTLHSSLNDSYSESSAALRSSSSTNTSNANAVMVQSSNIAGGNITLQSGNDLKVQASNVIANDALQLMAARNLSIVSAEQSVQSTSSSLEKSSGFFANYASGVASIGYSKSSTATQGNLATVTQQASSVGTLNGSATLKAGETLQVVASDIAAKENLTLIGKNIDLAAAQNTSDGQQSTQSKSVGFSIGVTVNPLAAFKDAYKSSTKNSSSTSAVGKSISQAEGVADGVIAATTGVVVQFGSTRTNGTQSESTSTARTSTLNAGKDLNILATDGSITSQGSQISAEGNALILAKDSITFDVAHNTESKAQSESSSGFSFDNRSRLLAGAFNNKGQGNGATDTVTGTVTGTQLSVGGGVTVATQTGNITLTGANVVAEGNLTINAARDLVIASAQDTALNANQSNNKAIGQVVISDTERFAGYHNEKHLDNNNQVTQVASNVSSLNGDVTLNAGGKYTQAASTYWLATTSTFPQNRSTSPRWTTPAATRAPTAT